ncbi:hypothetical protein QWZ08_20075 [Ferruginibacter paludis]|uniref:hypothetical protein n=1 Tax=Ferruginibacter paludis TaxID=1310417 RepID=UPI0025B437DC|nr:hypothetical protein [Ferruginibacter paludis]MDN3657962.1 hypothetical protein [Ferruginibacter paludis]
MNTKKNKPLPVGRPKRKDKDNTKAPSVERGTIPGDKRKTYIVKTETADKVDAIAYWDRISIKDVVGEAFENHIDAWEKKNGPLKVPKKSS